jgi:hypothetical protein
MYSGCVKRVFYSAFFRKCTDMCKHLFGVQLLPNPPLCSNTVNVVLKKQRNVEMGVKDQGNSELSEKEIQIIIIWLLETRRGRKLGLGV